MNETFSDLDSIIQISKEKETEGFDLNSGKTWIYPTNLPVRDYQFSITQAALFENTLVSLPTGLGKTLIAAVIMYNYYRWYPMGKIIFMAPTKPLVAQQMDACYNIMAIPPDVTAEMTGSKSNKSRVTIWQEKRVFFITPHILQNDIETVLNLAPKIKCIVIDEAHRALGKNANCEAIRKIQRINTNFRILALSATPGSNFNSVKDVITNLLISHIEMKTNESVDVAPYVFQRRLDTIVIPIRGKLLAVKNEYIKILDIYTRPLLQYNIFSGNCANLTKGRIVMTMKDFKERGRNHNNYGFILRNLNICVTLYHGYELLIRHGLRGFLVFFDESISKPLITSIRELYPVLDEVRNYLGPIQEIDMLPDGTIPEIHGELIYSHPKFQKLSEVLMDHFNTIKDADTRVMVFCEYRESVMEIYSMLLRYRPTVRPRIFLGKGGSVTQGHQLQAVRMFKAGTCNTLVSTCIGEEGLDVGEVDLIVCFDISSKSPIRMVQRMGRTGRKRDGRVVALVTEGKEQQLLDACMAQRTTMNNLLESQAIRNCLYKNNPRMIPAHITPQCNKMYITVTQQEKSTKAKDKKTTKKSTLKDMFENISSSQTSTKSFESSTKSNRTSKSPVKVKRVSPAKKTKLIKNQGDIRSMFSKINHTQQITIIDDDIDEDPALKELITGIKSYLNINTSYNHSCKICDNLFDCKLLCSSQKFDEKPSVWTPPDVSIIKKITLNSLQLFCDKLKQNQQNNRTKKENFGKTDLELSLQYFNLNSLSDLFSDDSTGEIMDCVENPILFQRSFGVLKSPERNLTINQIVTPENNRINDLSDTERSPGLLSSNRMSNFKHKVQRKLFSQGCSTPNVDLVEQPKNIQSFIEDLNIDDFQTQNIECNNFATPKQKPATIGNEKKSNLNTIENQNVFNTLIETVEKPRIKTPEPNIPSKSFNSSIEVDFDIWDETSFQNSDPELETNENAIINPQKTTEISDNCITNVSDEIQNLPVEKNTENNQEYDSDETIILSFNSDDIFKDMHDQHSKNTNRNSEEPELFTNDINDELLCINTQDSLETNTNKPIDNENLNNNVKVCDNFSFGNDGLFANITETPKENPFAVPNKSLCNKTDCSLLSVTQMIDFLNDSKLTPNKSVKLLENKNNDIKNISIGNSMINSFCKSSTPKNSIKTVNNQFCEPTTSKNDPNVNIKPVLKPNHPNSSQVYDRKTDTKINHSQNKSNLYTDLIENKKTTCIHNIIEPPKKTQNLDNLNQSDDDLFNDIDFNSSFKENQTTNNVITTSTQSKLVIQPKVSNIINLCESDEEEQSLLSFSQNSQRNRNKKLKLSLVKNKTNFIKPKDETKVEHLPATQSSPVKLNKKKGILLKKPIILSDEEDEDDDFELRSTWLKPLKKPTNIKPVTTAPSTNVTKSKPSLSLVHKPSTTQNEPKRKLQMKVTNDKKKNLNKQAMDFIEYEAEVKDDIHYISDSDEEPDSDRYETSFISNTQNTCDESHMQIKYLESIRSPTFKGGAFKIPQRLPMLRSEIYSQDVTQNDTYMNDSFCVGNDMTLSQQNSMSYLEMAELEIERQNREKRNKKRKRKLTELEDSD